VAHENSSGLSGRTQAVANLERFNAWVAERTAANDWADYLRGDKLNRSEIAAECNFALSVVRQNPAVKAALEGLEGRLRDSGVTKAAIAPADAATVQAADQRILSSKSSAERRVKAVEEQNAALKAEVNDLKQQLKQYKFMDEHLATTGRMLRP
jgi:hypothetical protein